MAEIRYRSTRSSGETFSIGEALENGLAPDGGLFLPLSFPSIEIADLPGDSFVSCSLEIFSRWLAGTEFEHSFELVLKDALNFSVPIVELDQDVFVIELFHGPTLSFKDFGARTMARLLGQRLVRSGKRITIMVATSGDTGSAVADGFAGIEGIDVVLLFPENQVSPVQEKQLVVERPGVHAFRVRGTFDDCQALVKSAFSNPELKDMSLSTANSINIGRLLPQMLYYMWAVKTLGSKELKMIVPSGNLGNLTAGVFASLSGMPTAGFLAAHNKNDFFPGFLTDSSVSFKPSVRTDSNAMDVGAPSNFERLSSLLTREEMTGLIAGASVSDSDTRMSMERIYANTGYVPDPHTAVGLEALRNSGSAKHSKRPSLVLSTAHPAKFPEIVSEVLGIDPVVPQQLAKLNHLPTSCQTIDPQEDQFAQVILELGRA